jgi:hypothetical protein
MARFGSWDRSDTRMEPGNHVIGSQSGLCLVDLRTCHVRSWVGNEVVTSKTSKRVEMNI